MWQHCFLLSNSSAVRCEIQIEIQVQEEAASGSMRFLFLRRMASSAESLQGNKRLICSWLRLSQNVFIPFAALRIKYKEKKDVFTEESILVKEPISLFKKWFDEALATPELIEPNAMCLSTATPDGMPSSR
jgi:hypothetical protein